MKFIDIILSYLSHLNDAVQILWYKQGRRQVDIRLYENTYLEDILLNTEHIISNLGIIYQNTDTLSPGSMLLHL